MKRTRHPWRRLLLLIPPGAGLILCSYMRARFTRLRRETAPLTENIGNFSDDAQGSAAAWRELAAQLKAHPRAHRLEIRYYDVHRRRLNTLQYYPRATTLIRESTSDFGSQSGMSEYTTPQDIVAMAQQHPPGRLILSSAHKR